MGLILDTGVFVQAERRRRTLDFSPWRDYGEVGISVITASELLVGVHRADSKARRKRRSEFVEAILKDVPIYEFTLAIARMHSLLFAELSRQGQMIGAHDLIIAATARTHDSAILTINTTEFLRVPDLEVIELHADS